MDRKPSKFKSVKIVVAAIICGTIYSFLFPSLAEAGFQKQESHIDIDATRSWSSEETDITNSIAWGDVDGDGDLDLAVGNQGVNRIYFNTGKELENRASWVSDESDFTTSVAWGDVDGDGDLDLVVGNGGYMYDDGGFAHLRLRNRIYFNHDGVLENSASWSSEELDTTTSVAWGDVDGDGDLDLAVGNGGESSTVRVHLNIDGMLNTISSWSSAADYDIETVAWADIDSDGDLDLTVGSGRVQIYHNQMGELAEMGGSLNEDIVNCYRISWGDMDGDGDLDLACGGANTAGVYKNHGGIFDGEYEASLVSAGRENIAIWGDLDLDSDLDLITGAFQVNNTQNRIFANHEGNFENEWTSYEADDSRSIALADVDGDGDLDIAVGNHNEKTGFI